MFHFQAILGHPCSQLLLSIYAGYYYDHHDAADDDNDHDVDHISSFWLWCHVLMVGAIFLAVIVDYDGVDDHDDEYYDGDYDEDYHWS